MGTPVNGGQKTSTLLNLQQILDLIFGIGSILAAVGLGFYGRYVLKKLKDISYL